MMYDIWCVYIFYTTLVTMKKKKVTTGKIKFENRMYARARDVWFYFIVSHTHTLIENEQVCTQRYCRINDIVHECESVNVSVDELVKILV
jgi:hypothetical protein